MPFCKAGGITIIKMQSTSPKAVTTKMINIKMLKSKDKTDNKRTRRGGHQNREPTNRLRRMICLGHTRLPRGLGARET